MKKTSTLQISFSFLFFFFLTLAVSFFFCFYHLGEKELFNGDETTHALATKSIWEEGRWWLPTINGSAYYNKPPLKMWLSQIPIYFFGYNHFSLRFLDATFGVLTVLLCFLVTRKITTSSFWGAVSSLFLLTSSSYLFQHGVREAVQDSTLVFIVTLVLFLLIFKKEGAWGKSTYLYLGILIGLGGLVKSVGALIILINIFAYKVFSPIIKGLLLKELPLDLSQTNSELKLSTQFFSTKNVSISFIKETSIKLLILTVPAFLLPLLYFLPHCFNNQISCYVFFEYEIYDRILVGYHHTNEKFFYLKSFWNLQYLPPIVSLVSLVFMMVEYFRKKEEQVLFLMVWVLVPVVVYSLVASKMVWYLYPSLPALAIVIGISLSRMVKFLVCQYAASSQLASSQLASSKSSDKILEIFYLLFLLSAFSSLAYCLLLNARYLLSSSGLK